MDTDKLSHCPLDISTQCTEELSQEVITATWEGSRAAEMQKIAWVAALVKAQQADPAVGLVLKLKETNETLVD